MGRINEYYRNVILLVIWVMYMWEGYGRDADVDYRFFVGGGFRVRL